MPDAGSAVTGAPEAPKHPTDDVWATLESALAYHRAGRHGVALGLLERAVVLDPSRPVAWFLLGSCRGALGQHARAAQAYGAALELDPANADAVNNLGVCWYELERLEDAERCFRRAVELRPGGASSWNNLGSALLERGNPEQAAPMFERALALDPNYPTAHSNLLRCEQYRVGITPGRLKALGEEWARRFGPAAAARLEPRRRGDRTLRLAFVSPDLGRTPMGYFLVGLLEGLDKDQVMAHLYSNAALNDDLTGRLRRAAAGWRDIRALDDGQLAELARADGIDVALDLAGHTRGNRLSAFARRLAPVQVLWAGFAGTTGVPAIDYMIADRCQVPEGDERLYSESVLRMPNDYVCYVPPEYAPQVGPLPAAGNGYVTFAAFHNAGKIGTQSIRLWSRVLGAVAGSRIVLKYSKLDDARNKERILDGFAACGIDPARVTIEGTSPHLAMLARYSDTDVALDSLPYSGGLTTLEALWMGVPVVTLPGSTFAGRHSLTHVVNAGFPELVARDEDDYAQIAAALAAGLPRLAALRRRLRPAMADSPVCDTQRFARDFCALLKSIA